MLGKYNKSSITRIGIFLTSIFGLNTFFILVDSYIYYKNLKGVFSLSFFLSLILFAFFLICCRYENSIVKSIHVSFLVIAGFITIHFSGIGNLETNDYTIHGEFIVILGVMAAKIYGLIRKRIRLTLFIITFLCLVIKFSTHVEYFTSDPSSFIFYVILITFFSIFFLLILESEESKMAEEASIICAQWTKEQVYNDIGRSVFSTFMHDYHTDHAIAHLETLEEFIDEGSKDEAKYMIQELRNMLSDDNDNILRVKEKIRLSVKDKPEIIDSKKYISDKVKYFKKAYKLSDCEITEYYNLDNSFDLYVIPIDFIGIIENLIKNAIEASGENRSIKVLLSNEEGMGKVTVSNAGDMIPWRNPDGSVPIESFRVGRTTKTKGSGWGVYSIIKRVYANNGSIKVYSIDNETEFAIYLPTKSVNRIRVKEREVVNSLI